MPSSNISLEAALATARREGALEEEFLSRLLLEMRNGDIKAVCAEFVKANLFLFHECCDLESAIDAIILSEKEKSDAFEVLSGLSNPMRHYWVDEGYYTFRFINGWVEVYFYGDFNHRFPGDEINSDFMAFAWVDLGRHVILCDDIENRSRREYMKIELNRLDFDRFIGRKPQLPPKTRGPKIRLYVPEVEQKAIEWLKSSSKISREQFRAQVVEWLGFDMSDTQFNKYYGKHWTAKSKA